MKINLTFEDILTDTRQLAININNSKNKYNAIISVAGGGLIPARLLRIYLNIPIYTVNIKFYNNKHEKNEVPEVVQWLGENEISKLKGKNILIVDDLDDTRGTLLHILHKLNKYPFGQIGVATLYNKLKVKCGDFPDFCQYFFVKKIENHWINFPWEINSDVSLENYSDNEII
jgi:hypoxanthine phosphoribosyltransferase